jgi:hypothetical protein
MHGTMNLKKIIILSEDVEIHCAGIYKVQKFKSTNNYKILFPLYVGYG